MSDCFNNVIASSRVPARRSGAAAARLLGPAAPAQALPPGQGTSRLSHPPGHTKGTPTQALPAPVHHPPADQHQHHRAPRESRHRCRQRTIPSQTVSVDRPPQGAPSPHHPTAHGRNRHLASAKCGAKRSPGGMRLQQTTRLCGCGASGSGRFDPDPDGPGERIPIRHLSSAGRR